MKLCCKCDRPFDTPGIQCETCRTTNFKGMNPKDVYKSYEVIQALLILQSAHENKFTL